MGAASPEREAECIAYAVRMADRDMRGLTKSACVELSDRSGIQWGNGMTRWCLIVALVFAAPGCQRQVLSDEQWARSVGISPTPAANLSEQLPDMGGAEFKDRPDDNPQSVNSASPEESSAPVSDNARKEAVASPPVPAPEAPLEMKNRSRQPWLPQSHGRHRRRRTSLPLHRRGRSVRRCETSRRLQLLAFRRLPRRTR